MRKKIAYWGKGRIGSALIKLYPKPDLIIDSNADSDEMEGIPLMRPDAISHFSEYYIVVTVMEHDEIDAYLEQKGLQKNIDFCHYSEYFHTPIESMKESLIRIERAVGKDSSLCGRIIISAPFFSDRKMEERNYFFSRYIMEKGSENFLILNSNFFISEEMVTEKLGCAAINIYRNTSFFYKTILSDTMNRDIDGELDEEEKKWVYWMEESKGSDDFNRAIHLSSTDYLYLKKMMELLKPRAILWWGGWDRKAFIMQGLAKQRRIPIRFAEYGWIPGTYQFDPQGIAGCSLFCDRQYLRGIEYNLSGIREIFKYVVENRMDSYHAKTIGEEAERQIKEISGEKINIMFVGMADAGMNINPNSEFWKRYISTVCSSSQEAFYLLKAICEKRGWRLIFKPHPIERYDQEKMDIPDTEDCMVIDNIPIDELIVRADVVVSITSAVDYKVLMYQKPLVQIGKNSLNAADCTYVVDERMNLEAQLERAVRDGLTDTQRKNYEIHMAKLLSALLWDDLTERNIRYGKGIAEDII